MKTFGITLIFLIHFLNLFAQKEAYNWYFGDHAGITFESGNATALTNSGMFSQHGTSVISDSTGSLLFYSDGKKIYNRNHSMMPNSDGLLGFSNSQVCICIKRPNSDHLYYIFTVGDIIEHPGLYYSEIDMTKDGGLGDIDQFKNIPLNNSNLSVDKITAVKRDNNKDIWIIVRQASQPVNQYHTYLVTSAGVNSIPFITNCLSNVPTSQSQSFEGQMKVSPDGKYLVTSIAALFGGYEVNKFDTENGTITPLYNFTVPLWNYHNWGVEFSADLKYLYLSNHVMGETNIITQFDLSLIEDKDLFVASMLEVGRGGDAMDLQIGPDGKIYTSRWGSSYLGVINNPSLEGTACNYDSTGIYLGGRLCYYGLPQFIQTYFLRFGYQGKCAGETFTFTPNFNPVPDSIHWNFGDPASGAANVSNDLSPQHIYYQGGVYTVNVFVRFPDGRTEQTSREVSVISLPEPLTFKDTTLCMGTAVLLQALEGYQSYLWSTGEITPLITVADTGFYRVEAVNEQGCIGRDTVHVAWYPVPAVQTDALVSPTTCGDSTGAFRGMTLTGGLPPFNFEWINNAGDVVGTNLDVMNLPVDNYYFWVMDQSGCRYNLFNHDIQNIESDLIIEKVTPSHVYCHQSNGKLNVKVTDGLTDLLWYSNDNGSSYVQNEGQFINLSDGSYVIKAKDSKGCIAVYVDNPVIIKNNPGVQVTLPPTITPETDANANGGIIIHASGDTLLYSLDGSTLQSDSTFNGLIHGEHTVLVTDIHNCDTTFTVLVPWVTGQVLHAMAGDTVVCKGLMAREPLMVSNFKNITSFELTLNYNSSLLEAVGYDNARAELIEGLQPVAYPALGIIKVKWIGSAPVSLEDDALLFDLILQSTAQGISSVDWDIINDATWFKDLNGNLMQVEPLTGSVIINPSPGIWPLYQPEVCQYSPFSQMVIPTGGTGTVSVTWYTPKGVMSGPLYEVDSAELNDSGLYRVKIVDELNCTATDSVQVKIIPLPEPGIETQNDTIFFSENFHLVANPGYYIYIWSSGENTNYKDGTEEGSYQLIIKTEEGCSDTTKYMLVNTAVELQMPTAFTPNGDGLNDSFKPVVNLEKVQHFSMLIYNRWGQRIFESNDPSKGWDASNAPAGIYNWHIIYSNRLEVPFQLRGSVALIK